MDCMEDIVWYRLTEEVIKNRYIGIIDDIKSGNFRLKVAVFVSIFINALLIYALIR